ncbi:viperin family antiviral radical SAM protein [Neptuniibacter sp. QD37_11]|uniref:viperin family antiviral radical SAM protein n=1 Tax=Neptuniibacter sp. QD37_11 TaxID=3398209 RepID=UPI0039F56321
MNELSKQSEHLRVSELVVNWHLTEACNYQCKYCYASWIKPAEFSAIWRNKNKTDQLLKSLREHFDSTNDANPLTKDLHWSDLRLSLAGGEPMLLGDRFKDIVETASELGFKISLITNGSFLNSETLEWLAPKLCILGISVDTTQSNSNKLIGRVDSKGNTLSEGFLANIVRVARQHNPNIQIKVNTVVNRSNFNEDLKELVNLLKPERWKILRALPATNHNLTISDAQFQNFIEINQRADTQVYIEDNLDMKDSYLMIDPHGRFYQNSLVQRGVTEYLYSDPILENGIASAFNQVEFSSAAFCSRYVPANIQGAAA